MVAIAGGHDVLGRPAEPGYEVTWHAIAAAEPDLILAMPCGYHLQEVEAELKKVSFPPEWFSLRAVRAGSVYAMDASSHFSRPGPRIAEGIAALVRIFRAHSLAANKSFAA
jgi:iron complex transport system substrate-binding protein